MNQIVDNKQQSTEKLLEIQKVSVFRSKECVGFTCFIIRLNIDKKLI